MKKSEMQKAAAIPIPEKLPNMISSIESEKLYSRPEKSQKQIKNEKDGIRIFFKTEIKHIDTEDKISPRKMRSKNFVRKNSIKNADKNEVKTLKNGFRFSESKRQKQNNQEKEITKESRKIIKVPDAEKESS